MAAMKMMRVDRTLWDNEDGFFYDLLRFPDRKAIPFRVRSLVGLIPLYAVERLEGKWIAPFPYFRDPTIDFGAALGATAFLVFAGALAGFFPAWRAARVNPVEALRDE